VRARLVAGGAPGGPRGPGRRRRDHDPDRPVDHLHDLHRGPERNKALGIWGALGGIGATTAWLIGGPLVDGPGWRWIFFINVPVGLAALALSPCCCARAGRADAAKLRPAGALTITGALVLLVYAVVKAPDVGWGDAGRSSRSPARPCSLPPSH
jgi:Major Facilitator Superfamily.